MDRTGAINFGAYKSMNNIEKEEKTKLNREWGQWKRRMLSKKERKKLSFAMFIDFLCCKGYFEKYYDQH